MSKKNLAVENKDMIKITPNGFCTINVALVAEMLEIQVITIYGMLKRDPAKKLFLQPNELEYIAGKFAHRLCLDGIDLYKLVAQYGARGYIARLGGVAIGSLPVVQVREVDSSEYLSIEEVKESNQSTFPIYSKWLMATEIPMIQIKTTTGKLINKYHRAAFLYEYWDDSITLPKRVYPM